MLISGRMENIPRTVFGKSTLYSLAIGDIANEKMNTDSRKGRLKFKLNIMHGRFGLIEKHDFSGLHCRNLTHDLTSDRPRSSGNHHDLIFYKTAYCGIIGVDCLAAKQILDTDIMDMSRQSRHCLAIQIKLIDLIEYKQFDMVTKENIGCAGAHYLKLCRQKQESVAPIVSEDIADRIGIELFDRNAVDCAVYISGRKTEQRHRIKPSLEFAFERRGKKK